ncbi:MAG: TolC family protein, partial [Kiritimatiellae bacterium]|nr:TolC family protein [Kiritimatiellia bacterium]
QDVLRTGDQLVGARKTLDAQTDQFKIALGLPADARVQVNPAEMTSLQVAMGLGAEGTNEVNALAAPALPWDETAAIGMALSNRHDLAVARGRREDAERAVTLAADALRPDLGLAGNVNYGRQRATDNQGEGIARKYGLTLEAGLPWERTAERNDYRLALLAADAATRAVETAEDEAKSAVRDGLRSLRSAWSSFSIQAEAVRVAMRRVRSTSLFQQAGRAEVRDVLEAEDALLNARNALVAAIVRYRMAGLELRRDMALLDISEEGVWRETEP